MPMSTKYTKKTGRTEVVLGEATSPAIESRADAALQSILNPKRTPGNTRKVKVLEVTDRFTKNYPELVKPRLGQVFLSTVDASLAIGAHYASVTTALSHAKRTGDGTAFVRGVKFAFVK